MQASGLLCSEYKEFVGITDSRTNMIGSGACREHELLLFGDRHLILYLQYHPFTWHDAKATGLHLFPGWMRHYPDLCIYGNTILKDHDDRTLLVQQTLTVQTIGAPGGVEAQCQESEQVARRCCIRRSELSRQWSIEEYPWRTNIAQILTILPGIRLV